MQSVKEHLMIIAMEECCEISHELSKAIRFGPDEVYEMIGLSNIQRALKEYNQLVAVLEMLRDHGVFSGDMRDQKVIDEKKIKVAEYMDYAMRLGVVAK